jgi:hypothetical protein
MDDERQTKPTVVTLHRKDAPLIETLREVGVQVEAGVSLSGDKIGDKFDWPDSTKISLDIEMLDYWTALRAIRTQTGFVEYFGANLQHLGVNLDFHHPRTIPEVFTRPDPKQMPYDAEGAIVAGPLLIAPAPLETRGENLVLTLRALPEARVFGPLREGGNYAVLQIDEYKDDQGQSLLAPGQTLAFPSMSIDRSDPNWTWRVEAVLPRPAAGRRIGPIKGRFGKSVGPPQAEVVAVDLTRGTGQLFEFDGVGMLVTSVSPSESEYTVTGEIIVPTNTPVGRAFSDGTTSASHLGARDKTGVGIPRDVGPSSVRSEGGVTTLTWTLRTRTLRQPDGIARSAPVRGGSIPYCTANCIPVALYWVTPSDTHWFQTPFELRDLAMPPETR